MLNLKTFCFFVCLLLSCFCDGCVVVIPTIPMNAPGYGHTYRVVDQDDQPIKEGFLILHSFYKQNDEMFRLFPINDGRVQVPEKIAVRCNAYSWWPYFPLGFTFYFENPYGTYICPVSSGYLFAGGWDCAPWQSTDFIDGLFPPPDVLRMREIPPDMERENLESLADPAQIVHQPREDQIARQTLNEYIKNRLSQLPPSKIQSLEDAIRDKNIQEVRHLLDEGVDPNFQHLYCLMTPLYSAVLMEDVEIVRLLIKRGSQVNVLDAMNRTPFYYARDEEIRLLLLKSGADPKLGVKENLSPKSKD